MALKSNFLLNRNSIMMNLGDLTILTISKDGVLLEQSEAVGEDGYTFKDGDSRDHTVFLEKSDVEFLIKRFSDVVEMIEEIK